MSKIAIIIGAGPAGLTAALELQRHSDVHPIVLEATDEIGGISRTIRYKGNRMDIGGHRFFSKSDRVMEWWLEVMPAVSSASESGAVPISYQNKQRTIPSSEKVLDPERDDLVMLIRPRKSRIYFLRKFFDYPIKLTPETLRGLGLPRTMKVGFSYLRARGIPRKPEILWKTSSSIASASSSINCSLSPIPRRSGACIRDISARTGGRSASRVCR